MGLLFEAHTIQEQLIESKLGIKVNIIQSCDALPEHQHGSN